MTEINNDFYKMISKIDRVDPQDVSLTNEVKHHIGKLEHSHDEFIKMAKDRGYDLNNPKIGEMEIKILALMKSLSSKIGLPVDKYDEAIKAVKIRVFGEENYKNFFGN